MQLARESGRRLVPHFAVSKTPDWLVVSEASQALDDFYWRILSGLFYNRGAEPRLLEIGAGNGAAAAALLRGPPMPSSNTCSQTSRLISSDVAESASAASPICASRYWTLRKSVRFRSMDST
jgi:hypothetical protein